MLIVLRVRPDAGPDLQSLTGLEIGYETDYLDIELANQLFHSLLALESWQQLNISLFGKSLPQPRLIIWMAEPGIQYQYSGLSLSAQAWLPEVKALCQAVAKHSAHPFNSVLLNRYRNGQDSMGWHSDDEPELGTQAAVAIYSLGETRTLQFRQKKHRHTRFKIPLEHNSLLLMPPGMQSLWQHALPKTKQTINERISLTFRHILS